MNLHFTVVLFKYTIPLLFTLLLWGGRINAEYRAYLLEIYDHIDDVRWEVYTGMAPDQYLLYHGGDSRINALMKATWMCWNGTGNFDYVCDLPTPRFPKFYVGDRVRVTLDKHATFGMVGTVEVALWREDLESNVYGVRFDTFNLLYARYFEFDLEPFSTNTEQIPLGLTDANN